MPGMRRHDIVGAGDRGRAEQPGHRLRQRCRLRGDHRAGADRRGAVRVRQPGRPPHRRRRQMLAGEQAEPARVRARQHHVAKAQLDRAGLALQQPARGILTSSGDAPAATQAARVAAASRLPTTTPSSPSRRSRNRSSPLLNWLGVDDAQQLEIVVLEHDAVIGRAPADMPPARRRVEAQPRIARPGRLEVADADDDMVDADELAVQAATLLRTSRRSLCRRWLRPGKLRKTGGARR